MAILYLATDAVIRKELQRYFRRGGLTRIRKDVYVDTDDIVEIEDTLREEWVRVANFLFVDPLAVYRTAVELRPVNNRVYLMVATGARRTVDVGPVQFTIEAGDIEHGVEPLGLEMKRSNLARQLLENLTSTRTKPGSKKKLGYEWVESQLLDVVTRRGEAGLNQLRAETVTLAVQLGRGKQQQQLCKMVSAVLKTHQVNGVLHGGASITLAAGMPFDEERVTRFAAFSAYLSRIELAEIPYVYDTAGWRRLAFYESYFSNYIEGTRFTIDEAEEIFTSEQAQYERHEDSHDLLSHVEIAGDQAEMTRLPESTNSLIDILKSRHSVLLAQRPNKHPGLFKVRANKAGSTQFVTPENLQGTLVQGFEIYSELPKGIRRALFMHFFITECHPFDDGNGRLARIMMNAELVAADKHKIIVPTVCRDNYLGGLRQATRQNKFRTITKVLHQLQQYSASINWSDYDDAKTQLLSVAAEQEADDGLMKFIKQLSRFTGDYQAG